ncbi:MAG: PKD domain-containing protein, partial [Candidatus Lutacidiplasmatales archaeon]
HDGYELLFGGGSVGLLGTATYTFQNGTWSDITDQIPTSPGPRFETQLTYDGRDGYAVLFGGYGCFNPSCSGGIFGQGPLNDTWTYSGGAWAPVATTVAPPTTENGALGYDSTDRIVVLLTECSCSTTTPVTETWTYAGGNWTNVTANQTVQPTFGIGYASLADSPWDKGLVLFGGQESNSTWLFSNGTWSNLTSTAGTAPSPRYESGFTADSTLGAPILFGGLLEFPCSTCLPTLNDTWEFYHGQWRNVSAPPAPWTRPTAQVADDPADRGILLWGMAGGTNAADTWMFGPRPNFTANALAAPPVADASVPVQLFADVSGGLPPYLLNWTVGNHSIGSSSPLSEQLGAPGNYTVLLASSDSANDSASASLAVELVANLTVSAQAPAADYVAGAGINFSAASAGGVGPFLSIWRFGDGAWSTSRNVTHVYASVGSYTAWFWTNDSAGASAGASISLTVTPALSNSVQESTNESDVGVPVQFHATPIGGVPPIVESWNFGDGNSTTGTVVSHTYSVPGSYSVTVWANDSVGGSVAATTHVDIQSLPSVSVGAAGPLDLGQSLALRAVVSNGTGPFSFVWQGLPGGCTSASRPDLQCFPAAVGTTPVSAVVTDAVGTLVESASIQVTVYAAVAGTLRLAPAAIDLGQSSTLSLNVTGGAPPVSASFTGLPPGCPPTHLLQFACAPEGVRGTFAVRAVLLDGVGETATTSAVAWTVNATLSVVLWTSTSNLTVGDNLSLRAFLMGGSPPFTYAFVGLPGGCMAGAGPAIDCVPATSGSFNVRVAVGDAAHASASANLTLTVDPIPTSSAPATGFVSEGVYGGIGAIVLVGVVVVAWALRRRRKRPVEPVDPDEPV